MSTCQFELWTECNNKCKFCYLDKNNAVCSKEEKLNSLDTVFSKINSDDIKSYSGIAFIGGEFFQGQLADSEVKDKFLNVMDLTSKKLHNKEIDHVWISATLTQEDTTDLEDTLQLFKDTDNCWIITSFDTIGRFHTLKLLSNWENNMKLIKDKYSYIKLNTCSIMTQDFIEKCNNETLDLKSFRKHYNTSLYLKQPTPKQPTSIEDDENPLGKFNAKKDDFINTTGLTKFFPKRSDFIKFMYNLKLNDPDTLNNLFNMQLRADTLYLRPGLGKNDKCSRLKDSSLETNSDGSIYTAPCGHSLYYSAYSDCNGCMMCDKLQILNS